MQLSKLTTPKLITDYPTPGMILNEPSIAGSVNYKWFVPFPKSIATCLRCFVASVETILCFLYCDHYVPIERIIENVVKHPNMVLKRKTGVAVELSWWNSKLYVIRRWCKHKKGMLYCQFFVKIRLSEQILFFHFLFFSFNCFCCFFS